MIKINKIFIVYNIILIITIVALGVLYNKNQELKANISTLAYQSDTNKSERDKFETEMNAYKLLYTSQENDINNYRALYKKSESELSALKNQIYISKERELKVSRGDYITKDLSQYEIMTVDEMNKWIAERAPKNSPFIGQGEAFLKASKARNLDPKFIVATSAVESGWGTSPLAKYKGNYFSIGAYNKDPYNLATSFNGDFESNILAGVSIIKNQFYNKGKTSLYTMQYNGDSKSAYCQKDDGSPDPQWYNTIADIIYK